MKLYFITSCKPITSEVVEIIQKNAINSWKWLDIEKEIIVFNREQSIKKFCNDLNVKLVEDYESSDYFDLPTWRGMRNYLENKIDANDYIVWINADIILDNSLVETLLSLNKDYNYFDFILTGKRKKWDNWYELSNQDMIRNIEFTGLGGEHQIDYFIFNKKHFLNQPKFYIARFAFDPYLMYVALTTEKLTIDCTDSINCINQNHKYGDNLTEEFNQNNDPRVQQEINWNQSVCRNRGSIDYCKYKIYLKNKKVYFRNL